MKIPLLPKRYQVVLACLSVKFLYRDFVRARGVVDGCGKGVRLLGGRYRVFWIPSKSSGSIRM